MSVFEILAIVFFILAFGLLAVSIIIFFNNDIASVIGDLSGSTRRKQIEQIRNQTVNMSYGVRKPRSSHNTAIDKMLNGDSKSDAVQSNTDKPKVLSSKPTVESQHNQQEHAQSFNSVSKAVASTGTVSLDSADEKSSAESKKQVPNSSFSKTEAETDVLSQRANVDYEVETEMPTDILSDEGSEVPTDVLSNDEIATEVLDSDNADEDDVETTVLDDKESGTTVLSDDEIVSVDFDIVEDDTFINTDEVIK